MSELYQLRNKLKSQLYHDRKQITAAGMKPICPICNEPITDAPDMHEVLIRRGDVRMCSDPVKQMIHTKENCVLVHHGACHNKADTEDGFAICVKSLLWHNGAGAMLAWLDQMNNVLKSRTAIEARLAVSSILQAMIEENITVRI